MRRSDREIKEFDEIIKVMEKCDICRLALHDEEYPYIVPLNFGMEVNGDQVVLYFHGALEGKKYELMKKNNKVCFEMDCSHRLITTKGMCTMEYESVIGFGSLEFVADADKFHSLKILMKHYHKENFEFNTAVIPQTKVFRLIVHTMTGKTRMKKESE